MNKQTSLVRFGTIGSLVAALALAASAALAEDAPAGTDRDDAEAQLEEAQARLEAAAREIAALTAQIVGDVGVQALTRLEELARHPRPVMLGINIGPVGEADAREDGVHVLGVTPGSAAEEAGIRSGDVLLTLGETKLAWDGERSPVSILLEGLQETEPGAEIELGYQRDGRRAKVTVEARPWSWPRAFVFDGEWPRGPGAPDAPRAHALLRHLAADRWGDMELVTLSPGLGKYFESEEGVLVVRAPADTTLGLQDGDVIVDIAGRTPQSPTHVARILRSYAPGERLVMTVVRAGTRRQLEADVPGGAEGS